MKTFSQPLSALEEAYYLQLLKEGNSEEARQAKNILIERNLRLVAHIAKKYQNVDEDMEDLISIGTIGLIKAIDNFDAEAHDVRFSTYGVPMIAGEIRRYLRDNSALRVSRSTRDTAYKILQAREKLTAETGREPTEEEIANALGIPRAEIALALDAISDPVSLSDPVFSDGSESLTVMDQVRDPRNTDESWIECMALDDAMRSLTGREKRILSLRFYDGKTQMEVASMVGISQAQVSRLEKNAIRQIKKAIFVS